jgi:uncharacterized protein
VIKFSDDRRSAALSSCTTRKHTVKGALRQLWSFTDVTTDQGFPEEFGRCADVGRAAALYPDMNFIIYHSGYEAGTTEGAYDPANATRGVDTLIKSVENNGIARNANVYAELGSTWRFVMRDPTTAAHLLGKLLKHIGEDNVLWGTDSIWYGSPQDQIQGFRSF